MHLVVKRILGLNNKLVSQLQEVINIEGHVWVQPCDLDEFLVDVLLGDLVQFLSNR